LHPFKSNWEERLRRGKRLGVCVFVLPLLFYRSQSSPTSSPLKGIISALTGNYTPFIEKRKLLWYHILQAAAWAVILRRNGG